MKKILKLAVAMLLVITSLFGQNRVDAAAGVSISAPGTVNVGESVKITLSNDPSGKYALTGTLSVSGAASGALEIALPSSGSESITVKANNTGTIDIKFSGDSALTQPPFTPEKVSRTATTNVVSPSSGGNSRPNDTGENTGQYNPDLPKGETEAEKAERLKREAEAKEKSEEEKKKAEAEKLEKTPLIESIGIVSESVRLKGENVLNVESKYDTFDYKITLPRNVDAFKLDLKPTSKDVKLTYDQMYKLDAGHDKVQVKVLAEKDEIKQEFTLSIHRYSDSDILLAAEGGEYHLLVDSMIDAKLEKLGIGKVLVDKKKSDLYYYEYETIKFALTYDNDNIAHWFLSDDKGQLSTEVFVFLDSNDTPRFIVNSMLVDPGTLNENKYQEQAFKLSDDIVSLDESLQFNNKIMAWKYDDESMITHELMPQSFAEKADKPMYEMVYVNESGKIVTAFVNFDVVDQNMMYLAMILGAAFVLILIIFLVYWRSTNKKINKILSRERQS